MYPYHLGVHLKTGRLCRIPHLALGLGIPVGFARVVKYKEYSGGGTRYPYDSLGELDDRYWSLVRWTDIQHQLNEPRTGPIILKIFISNEDHNSNKSNKD